MYQTFAFYKCFLTAAILLFCFSAVHTVLGRGSRNVRRPSELVPAKGIKFTRRAVG